MTVPESVKYIDAKACVVRAINRGTTFVKALTDFNSDRTNIQKFKNPTNIIRTIQYKTTR